MGSHPHFNDQGAVNWFTDLDTALAQAKSQNKKVFIESGRSACGLCRTLVTAVIPRADVKAYLNEHFVSVADDCDRMAPKVRELGAKNMANARTLPFVMLTDADGKWITGASGSNAASADAFMKLLKQAVEG